MKKFLILALAASFALTGQADDQLIQMNTNMDIGQELSLSVSALNKVKIDWGDGNAVEYDAGTITGTVKGTKLKVTGDITLSGLDCSNDSISFISIQRAPYLQSLNCSGNSISYLNLKKNTELAWLDISDNAFSTLTLTSAPALQYLDCSGNKLTTLNAEACSALTSLICTKNQCQNLTLPTVKNLQVLWVDDNQLTDLSLDGYTKLATISASGNKLRKLELANANNLRDLWYRGGLLNSISLTEADSLQTVLCDSNLLSTLSLGTFSASKHPYLIDCRGNNLPFSEIYSQKVVDHYLIGRQTNVELGFDSLRARTGTLSLTPFIKNRAGSSIGTCAIVNAGGRELVKGSESSGADYLLVSSNVRFWKAQGEVRLVTTSSQYPGMTIESKPFIVTNENGTLDGIRTVQTGDKNDDVYYDLSGRRVTSPVKGGIYISKGRKICIKQTRTE